ncbi:hypothetical protein AVEN_24930-1, partial [Araneus ventricosus]
YIYDNKFDAEDWKTTMDLYNVAIAYEITSLYEQCLRSLLSCLNLSNAHCLLELCILNPELSALKALYSLSLQICVKGAFHILDSEDFNNIQPSTVIFIASRPDLNVPNETYVLYSLWIRATIDCCRNNMELTYENIVHYFEPYSKVIEYKDVTEDKLLLYDNEFLMQYYWNVPSTQERIYPTKRQMSFPLQLPLHFFDHYYTGDIISTDKVQDEFFVDFFIIQSVYLIEFTIVCFYRPNESEIGIESLWIENGNKILFKWNRAERNSKMKLKIQEQIAFTSDEEITFQIFKFVSQDLIKLWNSMAYKLRVKTSNKILLWPEFNSKNVPSCPLQIKSNTHKSLKTMKFLQCPSVSCYE